MALHKLVWLCSALAAATFAMRGRQGRLSESPELGTSITLLQTACITPDHPHRKGERYCSTTASHTGPLSSFRRKHLAPERSEVSCHPYANRPLQPLPRLLDSSQPKPRVGGIGAPPNDCNHSVHASGWKTMQCHCSAFSTAPTCSQIQNLGILDRMTKKPDTRARGVNTIGIIAVAN